MLIGLLSNWPDFFIMVSEITELWNPHKSYFFVNLIVFIDNL